MRRQRRWQRGRPLPSCPPTSASLGIRAYGPDYGTADALATALVADGRAVLERIDRIADYEAFGIDLNETTQHTRSFPVV